MDSIDALLQESEEALDRVKTSKKTSQKLNLIDYAFHCCDELLKLDPKNATAHNYQGCAYFELGEYKIAVKEFKKALKIDSYRFADYYNIGFIFFHTKKYKKAVKYFSKTIKLNPEFADAYLLRGIAFEKLKKNKKAEKDFEKKRILDLEKKCSEYASQKIEKKV